MPPSEAPQADNNDRHMKYSETTVKICNMFRKIAEQKGNMPILPGMKQNNEQMDFEEYLLACRELLGTDAPLTDEILYGKTDANGNKVSMGRLEYLQQDGKLKMHLPEGYRCCIAVIPCTQYGFPLSEEEIKNGSYVRALIVDKNDMAVAGYTYDASTIFKKLPKQVQDQCTFQIREYDKKEAYALTDEDRKDTVVKYEAAYKNAQKIFNQAAERPLN